MAEGKDHSREVSFSRSLKFEVSLSLAAALLLAVGLFTYLMMRHHRHALLMEAVRHVSQVSEIVANSTRSAMLHNRTDQVREIVQDIGRSQVVLAKVRILSKDGSIIHSCCDHEVGTRVDTEAEACVLCHRGAEPLAQISLADRVRIFPMPEGEGRALGMISVIRNEPACYTAPCHVHPPERKVLGVLDVVYSLADIDRQRRTDAITTAGFALGLVLMAALLVGFVVHRLIYLPLRDLEQGSLRLRQGDLGRKIPVRRHNELGHLAGSFNDMMTELERSRGELEAWNRTLEQRVEEKTGELREAEGRTAQAEKLASVGLLAAGIAHELNNPLTGVLTFSTLIRKKMDDGSPDAEDMDLVIRETKRCSSIIKRLLDFAREERPEKKQVDLRELILETVKIIEHPAATRGIEIALDLAGDLPPIRADRGQIKQVVMNLLVNASDAVGEKGMIRVAARLLPEPRAPEEGGEPVPMVEIAVADTGVGIPQDQLPRLFDPFFTTKEPGRGTGLGLSVSYGIVRAHRGLIEVESTPGKGTTFRVCLPLELQPEEFALERQNTGG